MNSGRVGKLAAITALGWTLAAGWAMPQAVAAQPLLPDIHGLAFSADGRQVLVGTHQGLVGYDGARWRKSQGVEHDLMGFAATSRFLYTSGHPAPGSGLVNPLGLMKSRDGGASWEKLGLAGEADFHVAAASWGTPALWVLNGRPNSRMPAPGLYSTVNDGFMWRRAAAKGLEGAAGSLGAHPSDTKTIAVGTQSGLFLSGDAGENFRRLASGRVLAVSFAADGKSLWFSAASAPMLARIDLASGARSEIATPPLGQDAIAYIAHDPRDGKRHALASFERNVFLTTDGGKSWQQIAERGEPK